MEKAGNISDYKAYKEQVFFRETEGTTGIGDGIAIPHGKCDAVKSPGLAAMVIPNGVEYEALDGEPVDLLFLIAAPNTKDNVHLDVLAKLSRLLMHEDFVKGLKSAATPDEFLAICDKYDVDLLTNKDFIQWYFSQTYTMDLLVIGEELFGLAADRETIPPTVILCDEKMDPAVGGPFDGRGL